MDIDISKDNTVKIIYPKVNLQIHAFLKCGYTSYYVQYKCAQKFV